MTERRRPERPEKRRRRKSLFFSFRVVRADGGAITQREVLATLRYFVEHKAEPIGYRIEAINWKRGAIEGEAKTPEQGRRAMLEHFWYVLKADGLKGLRIGRAR